MATQRRLLVGRKWRTRAAQASRRFLRVKRVSEKSPSPFSVAFRYQSASEFRNKKNNKRTWYISIATMHIRVGFHVTRISTSVFFEVNLFFFFFFFSWFFFFPSHVHFGVSCFLCVCAVCKCVRVSVCKRAIVYFSCVFVENFAFVVDDDKNLTIISCACTMATAVVFFGKITNVVYCWLEYSVLVISAANNWGGFFEFACSFPPPPTLLFRQIEFSSRDVTLTVNNEHDFCCCGKSRHFIRCLN